MALTDKNLYAYCDNNPIVRKDDGGQWWITAGIMAIGGLVGAGISAVSSAITQQALTGSINWKSVGVAAVSGFVSGAIAASPLGPIGQQISGGIIGGLTYAADCHVNDREIRLDEAAVSVGLGVLSGRIGGSGANNKHAMTEATNNWRSTITREARRINQFYAQKAIASANRYYANKIALIAWNSCVKFSCGQGITNGVIVAYNKVNAFPNAPSYSLW